MFVSALFFGANFGPNVIIIIIIREYSVNIFLSMKKQSPNFSEKKIELIFFLTFGLIW
jgi:hypothetical protein